MRAQKSSGPDARTTFYESQRAAAEASIARLESSIDGIRKRADLWGKGALAVGSALITALGIGKLDSLLAETNAAAIGIAIAGFAIAILSVIVIGMRLSKVGNPIVMTTDPESILGLSRIGNNSGKTAKERLSDRAKNHPRLNEVNGSLPERLWILLAGLRDAPSEVAMVTAIYDRFAQLNGLRGDQGIRHFFDEAVVIEGTLNFLSEHPDLGKPEELDAAEIAQLIEDICTQLADDVHTPTMAEASPDKNVEWITATVRYALLNQQLALAHAALIRTEVRQVMLQAAGSVVTRRIVTATTGMATRCALLLIPLGLFAAVLAPQLAPTMKRDPPDPVSLSRAELISGATAQYERCLRTRTATTCQPLLDAVDALRAQAGGPP
ncbi:hypothetical protein [Mycolicibacterium hippocampi]|uniref:hypothetical protein n=1 Tax=Mycolicibacterium hippocampi TaxID=659824 RepID=UPI0035133B05